MPRICVLCGKSQSRSFSVFSFPSSVLQRNAWLKVIIEAKPDFINDKKFVHNNRLKNGVCELHFFRSEISKGKKRRLAKEAVPSLNIPASQKCSAIINSYKSFLRNSSNGSELIPEALNTDVELTESCIADFHDENEENLTESSLSDCTVQIEIEDREFTSPKVYKSMIDNIFEEEQKGICFCCGSYEHFRSLSSLLKLKTSSDCRTMLEELSVIFNVPKEKIIRLSTYVCRKCLKIIEDMLELRTSFHSLLAYLKNKFLTNNNNIEFDKTGEKCLHIDENKNAITSKHFSDSNDSALRKSNRFVNNDRKFSCNYCSEEFDSLGILCNHMLVHDDDEKVFFSSSIPINRKLHNCPSCGKRCLTKQALYTHMKSHQQKYDCPHCGRLITSKARLNYHIHKFHGIGEEKAKLFKCKSCDRSFASKAGLRYHEWSLHKAGKPYTCEVCLKMFKYRMLYNSHKLFAHGKKNIICEKCGEMFFTVSKLNIHINAVHRNAFTWICNLCSEKFTTASSYRHHIVVRHKRILYPCSHCNSQFRKKSSLNQHLWKHDVYICQKCNVKYDDSLLYGIHMSEIHNKNIIDKLKASHTQKSSINNISENSDNVDVCHSEKKEDESSIVINDILITSNDFENSNLQTLTFAPENVKERDDKSNFDELANVEPIRFDNVDSLEIQSVTNDPIELEEDVSLINVQILEDMKVPHPSSLKTMKENILSSEKQEALNIDNVLQNDIITTEKSSADGLGEIDMITNLSSPSLSCSKPSNDHSLSIVEPIVKTHLEQSDLTNLPVILQPVKNNNWSFETHSDTAVDPVIHSLSVENDIPEDDDPPVTREIDITIPSEDEESKPVPLLNPITDTVSKINDEDLSTLSVDIDGKGDVHYVMYFESTIDKNTL